MNLSRTHKNLVIVGDFNYPAINWADPNSPSSKSRLSNLVFIEAIRNSFLSQHVFRPTHHRPGCLPSTIDLVSSSDQNIVSEINHSAPLGKSHHHVLQFNININPDYKSNQRKFSYFHGNYENMRNELSITDWNQLHDLSVPDAFDCFYGKLNHLIAENIPKKAFKHKRKPVWMNRAALAKVKKKRHAYQQYLGTKDGTDYLEYTKSRNQAKNACRSAVRDFEKS